MIKSENGTVKIEGRGINMLGDLFCIIKSLKANDFPDKMIMTAVESGLECDEIVYPKTNLAIAQEILEKLQNLIKEMEEK